VAHIPDGFLSPPVLGGAGLATVAALAVAARRSRRALGEREAPLLGAATAFVFAAQMLNFPVGAGTSAHLLGGTLVAIVLGPWSAMLVMFAVVLIQALLFQDGGIAALGANSLNLAVLGAGGGWLLFRWSCSLTGTGPRRLLAAAAVAAFGSTVLVGLAVALELALSRLIPIGPALAVVGGSHAVVGLAEAGLTVAIVATLARGRPDLLAAAGAPPAAHVRALAWVATAAALAVAAFAIWAASSAPDVLETAVARLGLNGESAGGFRAPLAGYTAPIGGPWVAAALGLLIVFAVAWGSAAMIAARRRP
jgi:cobalt/nickel transport system permease protein